MRGKEPSAPGRLDAIFHVRPRLRTGLVLMLAAAMTGIHWLQLDLSCGTRIAELLSRRAVYHLVNLALVLVVDLLLVLVTRRWHRGYLIGSLFFCVWSVANHYTWLFSGDPITVTALLSTGTALHVLGGYRLPFDKQVAAALAAFLVNIALALALRRIRRTPIPWRRLWLVPAAAGILVGGLVWSLQALERVDPSELWTSRWDLQNYGYPVYFVRQAVRTFHQVQVPAGYSDEALEKLTQDLTGSPGTAETLPDIILILNETYYDLDLYTDVQADTDYMSAWRSADNAIRGHAAIPNIGGGTNRAEYELLTSNSMLLLASQAPFNTLDLSQANSVVNYLKGLGYTSFAMHAANRSNYSRGTAYPALGFDETRFYEDFSEHAHYGQRLETDEANYRDMVTWYEAAGDGPRLLYLLTYQNHGGYEQNDASFDTVHTRQDFGALTDDVDEYLTCMKRSDDALAWLMDYFNSVDRPVVLCMVGDHSPNFLRQLPRREGMTEQDADLLARCTPFLIWANDAFGPIPTASEQQASCVDLVPKTLEIAGLPLSPYYRYILQLNQTIPYRLSTGTYRTAAGQYGAFVPEDRRFGELATYYYMEYNNLLHPVGQVYTSPDA